MKAWNGVVAGVRVAHGTATSDELAAASVADERAVLEALVADESVEEAFLLQTCHRVEAYVVADEATAGERALAGLFDVDAADPPTTRTGHEASLRHLLRVAAGLESLVLGEDQVLGQLRDARDVAREADALGPVLGEAVTKALHVGERVRTETTINEGVVSLGSAAVRLLERERDLKGRTALVVGAGEMGSLAATALADAPVAELVVANRTPERAAAVVESIDFPATATGLDALGRLAGRADVVVTATASADHVLEAGTLADAGDTVVVDLGQPRDVAPAGAAADGVSVFDIDDLEAVTQATRERRAAAATAAEEIVDREFDRLVEQYKRKRADDAIAAMYEGADLVKERELATAFSRLEGSDDEFSDAQREVVASLADSLVSKLLAAPTSSLREAAADDDWQTIHTALRLFDPDFDGDADESDAPPLSVRSAADERCPDYPAEADDD